MLRGGTPQQIKAIDEKDIHYQKKGFQIFKNNAASSINYYLTVMIKPQSKLTEKLLYFMAMTPDTCLLPKRLLSFIAAYRYYCFKKLNKA
mmetsp:Transcript_30802/g.30318  ORF Transcript_30802/g.30318 Transcript_30802/m.30318 type:complete len:90 (+) Transcript_30802:1630-1899(+)